MAYIRKIGEEQAGGALARIYQAAKKRAGKVYEIVNLMSLAPRQLNASMQFYGAIVLEDGPLSRAHREMIAVVVSRANACHY